MQFSSSASQLDYSQNWISCSYNLHGWFIGIDFVHNMIEPAEVLCLQKNWH
jgi:hypothetical protein